MKLNLAGNQILDLLRMAQKALVILPQQPTADGVAAALACGELGNQIGKNIDIVCFGELPSQVTNLGKITSIKKHLDPTNLVVSFNWSQNMIEKVSYSVEGEKFNLIITPTGKKLDATAVEYSYRGANYDLIISFGVVSPETLPANLIDRGLFQTTPSINIDNQSINSNFGKVNVVDPEEDSLGGLLSSVFEQTHISINPKIAELLLFGIRAATNNFDSVRNPVTFEHAAFCTKMKNASGILGFGTDQVEEKSVNWFPQKAVRSSKVS